MTQDQLKSAVLALGFERDFGEDGALLPAISRALYTIFTDRPVTRTVCIAFLDAGKRVIADEVLYTPGESLSFPIDGRAFAFRVSGKGSYTVDDKISSTTEDFDTDMGVIKGHVTPPATITFSGDYAYSVRRLISVKHLTGPDADDIPSPGKWQTVDLSERYGDFLAPESEPETADGRTAGCYVKSGVLYVPSDFVGELYLTYRRKPTPVFSLSPGAEIDIPAETEELLPLLVAAYLWLDDAPDKAQYYMALYREGISGIKRFSARAGGTGYVTDGWA